MRWRAALAETTASSNAISLALASDKKQRFTSRSCLGREPPHPNTQSAGYDECYHAYPHGCVVGSDRHLGMLDQSQGCDRPQKVRTRCSLRAIPLFVNSCADS